VTAWLPFVVATLVMAAPTAEPGFERAITPTAPGRTAVVLDAEIYRHARRDLGDLRVIDDRGAQVPFLLERHAAARAPELRRPQLVNRGFQRGRSASVTLDFGAPLLKRELALSLSGDNFRRRVEVESSSDGQRWLTLTDSAYVFAVPEPAAARYETIRLPRNDHRYLRVTVLHGPDDPEQIEIREAFVPICSASELEERVLRPRVDRFEDPETRETHVSFDLGTRRQPFSAIVLAAEGERFFRGVVVEGRRQPTRRRGKPIEPVRWVRLGEGAIYRYEQDGRVHENLRLQVVGREQALRLRVRNRDDPPLELGPVSVVTPVERLVFEAGPGERYRLRYGAAGRRAPHFDLTRTLPDSREWSAGAALAELGPPERLPPGAPEPVPWSERHPALLWAGMLLAVLALGALTWKALRAAA